MNKNAMNSIKNIFSDYDIQQKEIAKILNITQAGVSKKIKAVNFTITEIIEISICKNIDLFSELSILLPITIRNKNNLKETFSQVEIAILNLVKKSK